eukprot:scaffold1997_cov79-Cyclotella_meneghiniana.AAC.1
MSGSNTTIPIVFIHGWKASVLVDKNTRDEKFNYAFPHLLGLGGPSLHLPMEWEEDETTGMKRQAYDDMVASHPTHDVSCLCGSIKLAKLYGPLLDHLAKKRGNENVHCFAYDWRRELTETSHKFEAFLEGIRSQYSKTGVLPQVIGHSMGCLITLHVLNRRPDLFHSVLFGAGALAPNFSLLEDYSIIGGVNTIIRNNAMFTPSQHLTNPGPTHMLIAYPGEREAYGRKETNMLFDASGQPVEYDLNKLETWAKLKIGMYHPNSGVQVTAAKEAWFRSVLNKCLAFRKGLIPSKPSSAFPPVAVLRSDGFPSKFGFHIDTDGHVDFSKANMMPGDGRVIAEDSLPPNGIPLVKIITNKEEHSAVLNDLKSVDNLLDVLVVEATQKI